MDEDEEDALAFPIDAARASDGGQDDVLFRLKQLFQTVIDVEAQLAEDREDLDVASQLARAREEYRFTKEYAADTASQQTGLTAE